ncbi:hypothetical protein [Candidatus Liberibacter solanacearum]|uniref:Transmembrane protein n=1 Tax=Candidatus Liberibacter solanacearum TaxID=556287 RepID=A0A1V2N8V2_9HYPH|nr:hypothetical protein [Candidatus Liberibacter solanacearum]ONI58365.1 hypothetical protein AYJ09_05475 [Candidatus Liberibacter solanacearum]ONI60104.1 hypothetical protein AYO25_01320 [Candidatus Liberibacter solanacearum]
MKWIVLLANIIFSILSCVFIKISTTSQGENTALTDPMRLSNDKFFWLGFFFYAASFFFYIIVVSQFSLQVAQTLVTSSIIIIVTCFSSLIWNKPFYWTTGIGILLITLGITLISFDTT